jgi:hypothetical protein
LAYTNQYELAAGIEGDEISIGGTHGPAGLVGAIAAAKASPIKGSLAVLVSM